MDLKNFMGMYEVASATHKTNGGGTDASWHPIHLKPDIFAGVSDDECHLLIPHNRPSVAWLQVANHLNKRIGTPPKLNKRGLWLKFDEVNKDRFLQFLKELSDEVQTGKDPEKALVDVLPKWFAFWGEPGPRLDVRAQTGLLGELLVLEKLANHNCAEAIKKWTNAKTKKQLHDFVGTKAHIEVKCSTDTPHTIHIGMIDQMDHKKANSNNLFLVFVKLEKDQDKGQITLPKKVKDVRDICLKAGCSVPFDEALKINNYSEVDEVYYSSRKFKLEGIYSLKIDSNTPIHTEDSFTDPTKGYKVKVSQSVDIGQLTKMKKVSPASWKKLSDLL